MALTSEAPASPSERHGASPPRRSLLAIPFYDIFFFRWAPAASALRLRYSKVSAIGRYVGFSVVSSLWVRNGEFTTLFRLTTFSPDEHYVNSTLRART